MTDDPTFKMYEAQAELVETREELERIRRERDELKNQMAANNFMKTVDDFQRNNSDRLEAMEENLRRLTTTVSNSHETFTEIKETLKNLKETTQVQKENEKSLVNDHAKLSKTIGVIQVNFNTLSTKVSSNDQILSAINETLRKQNKTLATHTKTLNKLNEINKILTDENKKIPIQNNMKTLEKETILLIGGRGGGKMVDSLLILQDNGEIDGNWKQLNIKLPYAIWLHGAQFLNNYLYIFGGTNEKKEVLSSSYKLKRGHRWLNNNLQWEKMADMNEKRTNISNSSVILNDRIWIIGGCNEKNHTLKSVEMYDPQTNIWTNKKEMNQCRELATAAVVNGKIFCCGGRNGDNYLKSAECYDPSSNVWTFISDMPGPNAAFGAVVIDGNLVFIGGKASRTTNFLSSVWVLDTADRDGKWIEKEPFMSRPLCQFSIAKIDDKIFVCGGIYIDEEDSKVHGSKDVEIFDGQVWRNGPKLTTCQDCSTAVVIPIEFARFLN